VFETVQKDFLFFFIFFLKDFTGTSSANPNETTLAD